MSLVVISASELAWRKAEKIWNILLQVLHGVYQRLGRAPPPSPSPSPSPRVFDANFVEPRLGPVLVVTAEDVRMVSGDEFRRVWGAELDGEVGLSWWEGMPWEDIAEGLAIAGIVVVLATGAFVWWRRKHGGGGGGGGAGIWGGDHRGVAVVLGGGGNGGGGEAFAAHQVHRQRRVTFPASVHLAVDPFAGIILAHPACQALFESLCHTLPMDYVTIDKIQSILEGKANQSTVRSLIDKMVQDGYIKNSGNRKLGKAVIHSEVTNRKLLEIKRALEVDITEETAIDTSARPAEFDRRDHQVTDQETKDASTKVCFLHSAVSDLTCTRELPEQQQKNKDPSRTPTSMHEPATSLESGVLGQRNRWSLCALDKRSRKALNYALPMDYVTIAKLQRLLDGEANQSTVRKLIEKMVQDGLGKAVIHSEVTNRKLLEIKKILEVDITEEMTVDTNARFAEFDHRDNKTTDQEMKDGSTNGCFHSAVSDLTRTRELPEQQQNNKDLSRAPTSMREQATSLESGVLV